VMVGMVAMRGMKHPPASIRTGCERSRTAV
jgi:hypothetical protein